jgi:hypothetical protein
LFGVDRWRIAKGGIWGILINVNVGVEWILVRDDSPISSTRTGASGIRNDEIDVPTPAKFPPKGAQEIRLNAAEHHVRTSLHKLTTR